jgi:hypothetical protein
VGADLVTFASAERAYLTQPEDWSCEHCEDDDSLDHDDCVEAAADAYDDAMAERAEARAEED